MRRRAVSPIAVARAALCGAWLAATAMAPAHQNDAAPSPGAITDLAAPAVEHISADSLRGHLSFLASDLLAGRGTPSPGLEIAAHYIAAQFRRAGLEAIGGDGYFQIADWAIERRPAEHFALSIHREGETFAPGIEDVSIDTTAEFELAAASIVKIARENIATFDPESIASGSAAQPIVIMTDLPGFGSIPPEERRNYFTELQTLAQKARSAGAAVILNVDRDSPVGEGLGEGQLIDPADEEGRRRRYEFDPPMIRMHGERTVALFDAAPAGLTGLTVDLTLGGFEREPVQLKNVAGVLRGGDPELRDTYIIVSAHYDHLGQGAAVDGDSIFNGANDDGSGVASLLELAAALRQLDSPPARSIIFLAVFGEERGLLGSRYYVSNPLAPLDLTIANLNLEQLGRTDSSEGDQTNRISFTGHDYSTLPETFAAYSAAAGVEVIHHPLNSESYFRRSDNAAFAAMGIPAHTACVAFQFPDYHGLGDHWEKIDFENLARVNRLLALGLMSLANSPVAPEWNEDHPRTAPFIEAANARRAAAGDEQP